MSGVRALTSGTGTLESRVSVRPQADWDAQLHLVRELTLSAGLRNASRSRRQRGGPRARSCTRRPEAVMATSKTDAALTPHLVGSSILGLPTFATPTRPLQRPHVKGVFLAARRVRKLPCPGIEIRPSATVRNLAPSHDLPRTESSASARRPQQRATTTALNIPRRRPGDPASSRSPPPLSIDQRGKTCGAGNAWRRVPRRPVRCRLAGPSREPGTRLPESRSGRARGAWHRAASPWRGFLPASSND